VAVNVAVAVSCTDRGAKLNMQLLPLAIYASCGVSSGVVSGIGRVFGSGSGWGKGQTRVLTSKLANRPVDGDDTYDVGRRRARARVSPPAVASGSSVGVPDRSIGVGGREEKSR
jgi:hypothetical protein